MLTADQLDGLSEPITRLYARYEDSIIQDIARRLGKMPMTETAAWQMQRLIQSGAVYENALEELAKLTNISEATLRQTFEQAGVQAMRFDDSIYRAAGLNPLPLNLSPAMTQVLAAGLAKTNGVIRNMTMTAPLAAQEAYISAVDLAYMQVSTGAMAYTDAIRAAVKDVAARGLNVVTYAGHKDQLDVAVRRAVLTGVNQTTGKLQEARADQMGSDLVQTSAHIGARPDHQVWQGQVFSRSGTNSKYPPFVESTGYGTGPGLMGWNCRHSFYPFFEGISENAYNQATLDSYVGKTVTYNGKELSVYDATQKQRYIERGIRHWKRQADALEAAGEEAEFELAKVREWQGRMREFTRQTGLSRQRDRERIFGVGVPPKPVVPPATPPAFPPAISPDIHSALLPTLPRATVHDAAEQIIALHEKNEGSTFSLIHGNMAGRPYYSVSIFPDLSVKIMGKSIDLDILEKFIRDHEDLARNIKVGIGTWYNTDDGHTYLDFVALIEDRGQAVGLGKKYNQIGIFGLKDFEYIETGGTGEANTDLLSLLDRLREIFNETGN